MPTEKVDWLVCFAVPEEARFFQGSASTRVLITGMGRKNTARAYKRALENLQPRAVLTCGFAGGLDPGLRCASVVFDAEKGSRWLKDLAIKAGAVPGKFHGAEKVAVTAADKKTLREATGASAVEMESEEIVHLSGTEGIPALTLRVILDEADEDLPLDFNQLMTADMKMNYLALAWAILRNPGKIRSLKAFQKQVSTAAQALAQTLTRLTAKAPPR